MRLDAVLAFGMVRELISIGQLQSWCLMYNLRLSERVSKARRLLVVRYGGTIIKVRGGLRVELRSEDHSVSV